MVDNFINLVSRLLTSVQGITVWCGLTIGFAALFYFRLRAQTRRIVGQLGEAQSRLEACSGAEEFAREYSGFNQYATGHELLGHVWTEFTETLVLPRAGERRFVVRNTVEASGFFNLSALLEGRVNLRFYREISNYLPGLGILGTFVGLTAGIYLAQKGLVSPVEAELKLSLQNLLKGASLAFWTSIVGLVCSLVYSVNEKRLVHRIQLATDKWCEELDKRLERATLEAIAGNQLLELQAQTLQLERFNTDLAISISSALDERLSTRLAPVLERSLAGMEAQTRQLERLNTETVFAIANAIDQKMADRLSPALNRSAETLEAMRNDRQESNQEMLQKLLGEFQSSLTGAAGSEIAALGGTLGSLAAKLEETAGVISGAGSQAGREFEEAGRAAGIEMRRTIEDMLNRLGQHQARQEESVSRLIEQLGLHANNVGGDIMAASQAAGDGLRSAAVGASSEILAAARGMNEAVTTGSDGIRVAVESFGASVGRLESVVLEAEVFAESSRQITTTLKESLANMASLNGAVVRAATPLMESSRALNEQLERQKGLAAELSQIRTELVETIGAIGMTGQALEDSWDRVNTRFEKLDEALAKSFTEINTGVEAYSESVREFVQDLDQNFSKATNLLSGVIQDLSEVVEELPKRV